MRARLCPTQLAAWVRISAIVPRRSRHITVVGLLLAAVAALLLTSHQMSELRDALPSLSLLLSRLDHLDTPFDMPHVALFTLLAAALRVLLPGLRWWRLLLGIAVLAAGTELLQFLTIGRTPSLLDVRDDLVGTCVGLLAGSVPMLLAQWGKRGRDALVDPESTGRLALRRRLATVIANPCVGNSNLLEGVDGEALIAVAESEGVTSLFAESVLRRDPVEQELQRMLAARERRLAKMELGQHTALIAVLARLRVERIPVLVLKGAALRCWLYPKPHLRESSDLDLLFASREGAMAAVAALQPLGYATPYLPGRFAHEIMCRHAVNRVDLDLHWGLSRSPAMAFLPGFESLYGRAQPLPALGPGALGLGAVDALLHACVHRASNLEGGLGDRLKWLYDVHLLTARLDAGAWDAFVADCRWARVSGIAGDALDASSATFGSVLSSVVMETLQAGATDDVVDARRLQDWIYMQRQSLRSLPDWSARGAWLWGRMFPPFGHMRELYGCDLTPVDLLHCRLRGLFGRLVRAKVPLQE